jgi:phospholipase A1/A2
VRERILPAGLPCAVVLAMSAVTVPAFGVDTAFDKCRDIPEREARLDCFDSLTRDKGGPGHYLSNLWKLGPGRERIGFDQLQTHRPVYVLLDRWTNNVNQAPSSPAPDHNVNTPLGLNSNEVKFQLSFKSELISPRDFGGEFLGLSSARLWFAYTQQSHWQLYSPSISRPFRETDYEPELILTLGTANEGDGWKLLNFGLVHQSNGRAQPESRSWNRIYAQGGWEWNRVSVLARVWARIPESPDRDDNPDIQNYMGRGDALIRWDLGGEYAVSLLVRHTLGSHLSRGFLQMDLTTPALFGPARGYVQMTSGYGESLIDYNFRQTTLGFGIVYREW